MSRHHALLPLLTLWCLVASCSCARQPTIRIQNLSPFDYTRVSVAGKPYGDVAAGATSEYRDLDLTLGYAALRLRVNGKYMTGQTLNLGAKRFTHRIDVEDFDAGHLAIEVVRDGR